MSKFRHEPNVELVSSPHIALSRAGLWIASGQDRSGKFFYPSKSHHLLPGQPYFTSVSESERKMDWCLIDGLDAAPIRMDE
ncbi:hypothetical protein AVEN_264987-1 [Araneus ventricosus]|uniref:Uncharacterized protein n=1 Tax=Araneus ventricosus TaxID=182803 RepID=A0A4Y2EQU2_ARAVE|nr:hypothetical protein AVEN_264987-1 [Araneus ventricosus]